MQTLSINDLGHVVRHLEHDPLRNIVLLKHIEAYPRHVSAVQIVDVGDIATLVLLDTSASAYDRDFWPVTGIGVHVVITEIRRSMSRSVLKRYGETRMLPSRRLTMTFSLRSLS